MTKPDFSKIFAQNGAITALTDSQFLQGFDYLGDNPPTKEEFNWLFQQLCLKLQFLDQQSGAFIRQPNKAYAVGDIAYSPTLPSWAYLECTVAGTTAAAEPAWPAVDQTVMDGTVTWIVRTLMTNAGGIVAGLLTTNGWVKFANGLILQWGKAQNIPINALQQNIVFPIAFQSAVLGAGATIQDADIPAIVVSPYLTAFDPSYMTVTVDYETEKGYNGSGKTTNVLWWAIGI